MIFMDVGQTVNGYRVLSKIGQGGMGTVHRATSPTGEIVALKTIHPHLLTADTRRRLTREIETMSKIRHPNVARIIDGDGQAEVPFIVTEFIEGPTLTTLVRKRGPLNPLQLARLARGLGNALASMHHEDVVHRDLKPGNVMMRGDEPCIIDFGIAHVTDGTRLTQTGSVMGTPGYTPPEVLDGADLGINCDWWAWAVTVVFAATGREPFGDTRRLDALWGRILQGKFDLTGVPEELYPQLAASLNPDPSKRPHASELQVAINDLERDALAGTVTYHQVAATAGGNVVPAVAPTPVQPAVSGIAPAVPVAGAAAAPATPAPAAPAPATPAQATPTPGTPAQAAPTPATPGQAAAQMPAGVVGIAGSDALAGGPAAGGRKEFLDVNEERPQSENGLSDRAEDWQRDGVNWLAKALLAPSRSAFLAMCAVTAVIVGGLVPLLVAQVLMGWVAVANIVGLSAAALERKRERSGAVGAVDVAGVMVSLLWRVPQGIVLSAPAWVLGLLSFLVCGTAAHLVLIIGDTGTMKSTGFAAQMAAVAATFGWLAASWFGYGSARVRFGSRAIARALTPSRNVAFGIAAFCGLLTVATLMVWLSNSDYPKWAPWFEVPWHTVIKQLRP